MLTPIKRVGGSRVHPYWLYHCNCGADVVLRQDFAKKRVNQCCNRCAGLAEQDISGQQFNSWLVLERTANDMDGKSRWLCRCECGVEKIVSRRALTASSPKRISTSCHSCAAKRNGIKNRTHGLRHTRAYKSWAQMKQRCTNPNTPKWEYYGGAGVTFCERWAKFEHFYADMGERPEGTSLDRYPISHGNYEPGNCRWASTSQQGQNQTATKLTREIVFEILGSVLTPKELASKYGVSRSMIYDIRKGHKWKDVYAEFHSSTQT